MEPKRFAHGLVTIPLKIEIVGDENPTLEELHSKFEKIKFFSLTMYEGERVMHIDGSCIHIKFTDLTKENET